MTTEEIFERLRELQDVLTRKITLEKEMEDIPKVLSSSEGLVERLKRDYIEKDQEYVAAKKKESEAKNAFSIAESDREKSEKRMDAAATQREIEAINKEIEDAALREDNCRKDLHQSEQKLAELNETMKQKKEFMDGQEAELIERKKNIEKELDGKRKQFELITADEKRLTDGLDSELIFKFERIIRKKRGRGVVAVKGREHPVCQSCHMILPIQFAAEVRKAIEVLSCPYCSSILFYEEAEDGEEEFFDEGDAGSLADLDDIEDELEEEEGEEEEVVNIDYEG
jgi:predicted  nucleic acid-binding Zn-ribbon protein